MRGPQAKWVTPGIITLHTVEHIVTVGAAGTLPNILGAAP